jgi:hypothetical protein
MIYKPLTVRVPLIAGSRRALPVFRYMIVVAVAVVTWKSLQGFPWLVFWSHLRFNFRAPTDRPFAGGRFCIGARQYGGDDIASTGRPRRPLLPEQQAGRQVKAQRQSSEIRAVCANERSSEECAGPSQAGRTIASLGSGAKDDYLLTNPTIRNAKAIVRSTTRQR